MSFYWFFSQNFWKFNLFYIFGVHFDISTVSCQYNWNKYLNQTKRFYCWIVKTKHICGLSQFQEQWIWVGGLKVHICWKSGSDDIMTTFFLFILLKKVEKSFKKLIILKQKLNLFQTLFLLFLKLREAAYVHRLNDSRVGRSLKSSSILSVFIILIERRRNIHFELITYKITVELS